MVVLCDGQVPQSMVDVADRDPGDRSVLQLVSESVQAQ